VFLYGWIKSGKVSEKMESVCGHECWKVEVSDIGDCVMQRYQFWLDPAIGFNPRRIRMDGKMSFDINITYLVDMEDYTEGFEGGVVPPEANA